MRDCIYFELHSEFLLTLFFLHELLFSTILGHGMVILRVLDAFRAFVNETFKGISNVVWHEDMTFAVVVVPVDGKSQVLAAFPIYCELVMLFDVPY